jgi:hypothetical protein
MRENESLSQRHEEGAGWYFWRDLCQFRRAFTSWSLTDRPGVFWAGRGDRACNEMALVWIAFRVLIGAGTLECG